MSFRVILFYKYTNINDPEGLMKAQRILCEKLKLKGRIIVAKEGINGTLEGFKKNIDKYCAEFKKDTKFADVNLKFSEGNGNAFPKLSIKVRQEIVAGHLGSEDIDPNEITGNYVTAEQLHEWFKSNKEFYIVDMRNDFEQEVGMFEGSIKSGMHLFRDLPKTVNKIKSLKNKTIVTVCTGGVRCEKASGFLVKNGFNDVYQLQGGIHTYIEKYPNQKFKGALYVFDQRIIMGFNMEDPKREIMGKCVSCSQKSERFVNCKNPNCNRHFIACENCSENGILCPQGCFSSKEEKRKLKFRQV